VDLNWAREHHDQWMAQKEAEEHIVAPPAK
jgi:hypothetical protein